MSLSLSWMSWHIFGNSAHLSRNRRKVIFEGRKLRIRASCITVRSNSANSCWKSPQIEGQNLEAWVFIRNFASSKRGRNGAAATRLQRESPKNWKAGFQEWRVKDWEWRVKSEEFPTGAQRGFRKRNSSIRLKRSSSIGETELKQFDWNGAQASAKRSSGIRLKRSSSNSSEDKREFLKLMFN